MKYILIAARVLLARLFLVFSLKFIPMPKTIPPPAVAGFMAAVLCQFDAHAINAA